MIAGWYLWSRSLLGIFSLASILLCLGGLYLSFIINDEVKKLDKARRPMLDKKSKIVSDSILSIKNIKFNAWERFIFKKLNDVRRLDNNLLLSNLILQGVSTTVVAMIPSVTCFFCLAYLKFVLHKEIEVQTVYAILIYFNYLKKMMILGNAAIAGVNASNVSFNRIGTFLDIEDLQIEKKEQKRLRMFEEIEDPERLPSEALILSDCSLKWENEDYRKRLIDLIESKSEKVRSIDKDEKQENQPVGVELRDDNQSSVCLRGISLQVMRGSFSAVLGQVGSGKSSLLRGLLGDLNVTHGDFQVNGTIAYIPQEAFLINDTLRNNILFGKPYDEQKYNKVLNISQLRPDLEILIEGDLTEIGERGLNLSGGQKQRISIARAIYSDSEIYLVDDCMSALDSHVGGAILEQVFFDYLKGKTILMTTHRYHFLDRVDQVYVLKGGEILTGGDYDQVKLTQEFKNLVKVEKAQKEQPHDKKKLHSERKLDIMRHPNRVNQGSSTPFSPEPNHQEDQERVDHQMNPADKELKRDGSISLKSFKFYFSKGGAWLSILVLFLFIISIVLSIFNDWWAGAWIADSLGSSFSHRSYLSMYLVLLVIGTTIYIAKFYLIGRLSCNSSLKIFNKMMWNVLRRRMSFFDTSSSGVVINRCVDDMEIVDYEYAVIIKDFFELMFVFLGTLLSIIFGSLLMVFIILIFMALTVWLFRRYIKSSVELKRLYRGSRSDVLNCVSEMVDGYSSMRAYGYEEVFMKKWETAHNLSVRVYLHEKFAILTFLNQFFTLTNFMTILVFIIYFGQKMVGIGFIVDHNTQALALSNSISVNMLFFSLVSNLGDLITNTTVLERLEDYCNWSEFEADFIQPEVKEKWPIEGKLEIQGLCLKYRKGLPFVLRDLDFEIVGGEKVGIVGRTGSGKSTLFLGLTRIIEAVDDHGDKQGSIEIDRVDISTIGLHVLRRNITVIPQDPIWLEGTLRSNLDPMGFVSDANMEEVLDLIQFSRTIKIDQEEEFDDQKNLLDYKIEQRGSNLSLGQRQLVCIARALVGKPKILLMDEATASIDQETDGIIQSIIKHQLEGVTVVTIAHRLETIIQYDKILVLDNGKKIEEGSPEELLERKGHFYGMVREAGEEELERMTYFAKNKHIDMLDD